MHTGLGSVAHPLMFGVILAAKRVYVTAYGSNSSPAGSKKNPMKKPENLHYDPPPHHQPILILYV